ncbi:hypothetical protein PTTG_29124 [Puccinia triticina 1-1 BBBD Race 1]|uniref:Uncharacterized protein n=1 Tax=Puccinia triticina (isolate 1-1 / race 1 (BBBD)) TaxID=630390 RepID=A0A180G669_PUCT1|nr:hypothetical protein PTTG_29124 [Puccinia triticina 1-1 BBBD Race 1]
MVNGEKGRGSSPASITSISRPSSPSSKISAAAFREARAARNSRASISSSFSDIAAIPNLIHPDPPSQQQPQQPITQHARFKSSPAKAVSDYGHPPSSSPVKNFNRPHQQRSGAPSLISQIPDRHAASPIPPSPAGFPANSGLYAEHDILMPPRPAFYGSRMPVRSISSEQSPSRQSYAGPRISATLNRASTGAPAGLYNNPRASSSNASIRSVPVVLRHQQPHHQHPARLRSTTTTTTTPKKSQGQDPRHLDQWHSDDDDDPKPASAKPVRDEDEDEDEVPLSKLKKKSCSSLRDPLRTISPAQTLIRTRHQLHASVIHPFSSASSASASVFSSSGASTDDRRAGLLVDSAEVSTDWEWESRRSSTGKQPRQLELRGL